MYDAERTVTAATLSQRLAMTPRQKGGRKLEDDVINLKEIFYLEKPWPC